MEKSKNVMQNLKNNKKLQKNISQIIPIKIVLLINYKNKILKKINKLKFNKIK